MKFLLDSNAVIGLLRLHPGLLTRFRQFASSDFAIPTIIAHELFYGAFRSRHVERNMASVDSLPFEVLEFDKEDARQAAEIRAMLATAGTPIGPCDVLIADTATAPTHGRVAIVMLHGEVWVAQLAMRHGQWWMRPGRADTPLVALDGDNAEVWAVVAALVRPKV